MITYQDTGSGFPIVWIHGFPLSSEVFAPQTEIAGVRHIRPDLRGFGATPPADTPTSMVSYASDVLEVMDAAGIGRAAVAGLSMGGYVAMQLLRDAPDRVAALLLLDTRETPDTEDGRAGRIKTAEEVERSGTAGVVSSMLPKMLTPTAPDDLVKKARAIMESASPLGTAAASRAMAARPDSSSTLRALRVPALIVVGDADPITTIEDARRMAALIERATIEVVPGAAHLANLERPEVVNGAVTRFLTHYGFVV